MKPLIINVDFSNIENVKRLIELQQKTIVDLSNTLKRYAGQCERQIAGRPESSWNCEGYGWINNGSQGKTEWGKFSYMNNVGMVECGGGPELAIAKLREYNIIE